jgi:hypothetical protein
VAGVVGAVEREVTQRGELDLDAVQEVLVGVQASSTLFAAARSPRRW